MQREVEGILKWGVEFDQIMSEKQDKLFLWNLNTDLMGKPTR